MAQHANCHDHYSVALLYIPETNISSEPVETMYSNNTRSHIFVLYRKRPHSGAVPSNQWTAGGFCRFSGEQVCLWQIQYQRHDNDVGDNSNNAKNLHGVEGCWRRGGPGSGGGCRGGSGRDARAPGGTSAREEQPSFLP